MESVVEGELYYIVLMVKLVHPKSSTQGDQHKECCEDPDTKTLYLKMIKMSKKIRLLKLIRKMSLKKIKVGTFFKIK